MGPARPNQVPVRSGVLGFVVSGLVVAALLVLLVAPLASGQPDGLQRVAIDQGFMDTAEDSAVAGSPLADYAVSGADDEATGTRVAGLVGVAVTFGIGAAIVGVFVVLRRRSAARL
jgi:hypothetical protein